MKRKLGFVLLVALVLALVATPASAQLGDTDNSSFTVQNVGTGPAAVQITFYDESGTSYTPSTLNNSQPNPFTLAVGDSFEVYLPGIPSGLPDGRYSVVISSDEPLVAIANLIGENAAGTIFFNGSYSGMSAGADTVYLASIYNEYYNWNSLVSVQNAGSGPTDVTVTYTCGGTFQDQKTSLQPGAAVHFDLETSAPSGMPAGCEGSAVVSSTSEPVVVVDNQTADGGFTQSYNMFTAGANTVYVPSLFHQYYTWDSSLSISKIGSGTTAAVTVQYSDVGSSSCNLTDSNPGCLLYMPTEHPATGLFAATITSVGAPVIAVVNSANPAGQAQTYEGFTAGAGTAGLPTVMDQYYGWDTSLTCQNVSSTATTLNISYQNYAASAYNTASLGQGDSVEIYQPAETFLPDGYRGSVSVTANTSGAEIVCIANLTHGANQLAGLGDWSMSYSAK